MPGSTNVLSSSPPNVTPDSRAVMDYIRQIVHALETGSRAAQKSVGLSGAQLFILQTLAAGRGMSVNELAAASHTHQSSVSVVVSRLVEAKLVKRTASAADARRLELTVTAAGKRVLRSSFVTPQERLLAALDRLTPARLAQLRSLLKELVSLSGMDSGTPPMFFEAKQKPAKSNK
jgi:DNA-binding MarR family transcriptional regulator